MRSLIVIPTFNSQKTIKKLLSQILKIKPKDQILVINDGSTDNTLDIIKESGVKYIHFKKNMGKGFALRQGFNYCLENKDYDGVCTIDSDLQHPPSLITSMEVEMQQASCDIVIGNRMKSITSMPLHRICSNFLSSFVVSMVSGSKIEDSQCGFRLINKEILKSLQLKTTHFDTESEIIFEALKQGARIKFVEIPTIYLKANDSAYDNFEDTLRFINLVWGYLFRRNHRV